MFTINNTLSGKKEPFKPLEEKKVRLYVCGITPYDNTHIGHGRVYVSFDLLYRLLKCLGYELTYCRNFTDIDDKLLVKAEKQLGDQMRYPEVAQEFISDFHDVMKKLNCASPQHEPRVTENIPEIIQFIKELVDAKVAYVVKGDVYYSIDMFPAYGKLSKQKIDELRAGARVDVNEEKRDPLDFALWKSEPEGTFWQSPWGWGRPGWHIECSALARKFLARQIDIHCGGADLIFPHHENEIAQTEGLFKKPFSTYWMHNGFVNINKEKMSKSLGNALKLKDIFTQYDPMLLRFYFLNHHYRSPLDFSLNDLDVARKSYQRLCKLFAPVSAAPTLTLTEIQHNPVLADMLAFLCDDLNSTGMMGVLFEHLSSLAQDHHQLRLVKTFLQQVLGLTLIPLPEQEVVMTPEIKELLAQRERARIEKNWARADELREQLRQLGYDVQDKKAS